MGGAPGIAEENDAAAESAGVAPAKPRLTGVPKLGPRAEKTAEEPPQEKDEEAPREKSDVPEDEESLTTVLDVQQRTQLTILLAAATATMRDNLSAAFEAEPADTRSQDEKIMAAEVDPGTADVVAQDKARKALEQRRKEVASKPMVKAKKDAEAWFDAWREAVIGRVGEVVSNAKKARRDIKSSEAKRTKPKGNTATGRKIQPGNSKEKSARGGANEDVEKMLKELYPVVRTPLAKLDHDQRVLILHSMLLLLLSMEHYASTSRVLLLYLMSSLNLSLDILKQDEEKTAYGLLEAAKELSGDSEAQHRAQDNQRSRKWKVGLASVAGAAIVGVTGGMAAPMVAAGVGSVMGGLGLGTTAAAGYLGSVAGSSMLVGSLFGAYGGRMTGQMMDNYAKEVSDFAFIPVHSQKKGLLESRAGRKSEEDAGKQDPAHRRLRVTIGVTGWLTEKAEVVKPWSVLSQGSEAFALRWELEALMNLGNAITELMRSAAWGYARKEMISHTIFAELTSAMWPLALVKAARVVDNPFSIAKSRAEKAGEVLADALVNRAQGERPVNLIGYSLGARVIYSCLLKLSEVKAFGLVENVVLIGAPLPSETAEWRKMRSVVAGRLVNVYSENDYVLGFLYRTSSIQYGVAGLQKVEGVAGIENVDVTQSVSGHLRYRFMVGSILKKIGFEDIDLKQVTKEEEELKKMDEEEASRTSNLAKKLPMGKGNDGGEQGLSEAEAEKEADKMQQNVEEKTQSSLMQRGAELFHFGQDVKRQYDDARKQYDQAKDSSYLKYAKAWVPKSKEDDNKKMSSKKNEKKVAKDTEARPGKSGGDNLQDKSESRSYLNMASAGLVGRSGKTTSKEPEQQQKVDERADAEHPDDDQDRGEQEKDKDVEEAEAAETAGEKQEPEQSNDAEPESNSYLKMASSSLPSLGRK